MSKEKSNTATKAPFKERFFRTIPPHLLGIFRIGFGLLLMYEIVYFFKVDLIHNFLQQPFQFNYDFLPLEPMGEGPLFVLMVLLLVSTIFITLGMFYRWSMLFFFIGFTYLFLLDKAYYNNHLYLMSLMALIMVFIPADGAYSLRKKFTKKAAAPMVQWQQWLLQFQLFVVYFFGGIAKLNPDWMERMEPSRLILKSNGITSEAMVAFVTYGGLAFDVLIGFLLIIPKTRLIGVIGVIGFNISNHFLFDDINVFPFFMLVATLVFLDAHKMQLWLSKRIKKSPKVELVGPPSKNRNLIVGVISVYVLIQLWMPLRHYAIDSNVDWTGEGQRFAWRMKIQSKTAVKWSWGVFDMDRKTIDKDIDETAFLNPDQITQMRYYPEMALDFSHFLGKYYQEHFNIRNIQVKLMSAVSMNGRYPSPIVDMNQNLLDLKWEKRNEWILPIKDQENPISPALKPQP